MIEHKDKDSAVYERWLSKVDKLFDTTQDDLTRFLENGYPFKKEQIVGNCAWESLETGVYAFLTLNRIAPDFTKRSDSKNEKILTEINKVFDAWLQFTQLESLETYLLDRTKLPPIELDHELMTKVFIQAWSTPIWYNKELFLKLVRLQQRYLAMLESGIDRTRF